MPRHFALRPSRLLFLCIVVSHLLVMATFFLLPFPLIPYLALLGVLLASCVYYVLRDASLRLDGACVGLRLEGKHIVLIDRANREVTGNVQGSSVVTPYLTVLNIALDGMRRTRNVVILPDSMDATSFRQLRVLLKWGGQRVVKPGGERMVERACGSVSG